jgi:hypothetical protein
MPLIGTHPADSVRMRGGNVLYFFARHSVLRVAAFPSKKQCCCLEAGLGHDESGWVSEGFRSRKNHPGGCAPLCTTYKSLLLRFTPLPSGHKTVWILIFIPVLKKTFSYPTMVRQDGHPSFNLRDYPWRRGPDLGRSGLPDPKPSLYCTEARVSYSPNLTPTSLIHD